MPQRVLSSTNIAITGFMGTGKTTVGRKLAGVLGLRFLDADDLIEEAAGIKIKEIFEKKGERHFRSLEKKVIRDLTDKERGVVLSTGAGAIVDEDVRAALKKWGALVCLTADPATILKRVGNSDERPLLNRAGNIAGEIERLLRERASAYKEAHLTIDTTKKSVDAVVSEIKDYIAKTMKTARVEIPGRSISYPIMIEKGLLEKVGPLMKAMEFGKTCAIITNPTVSALYRERVLRSLEGAGFETLSFEIPDGEEYKNLKEVSRLYDGFIRGRLERTSTVLALGGGVVGDVAGFAAATFLRGIAHVQVPTTLMAQVDSSVGGKTGVNHPLGKNLIGVFHQPSAVFIDPDALSTLDKRELASGFAEVIKYGVIRDRAFFDFIEERAEELLSLEDPIITAIERSCSIKASIVSEDERERGLRAILNFGHTFGHAVETLTGYKRFRHGEAVSIGMAMAAELSAMTGLTEAAMAERIKSLLGRFALPVEPPRITAEEFLDCMRRDKKVRDGKIRFILVEDIGKARIEEVGEKILSEFFRNLKKDRPA